MAITIGAASFPTLTAQPFGYEETDTLSGKTARRWEVTGLLKPSEWLALLSAYDAWRDARLQDEDTAVSRVVGTTIAFSGNGPGGQSWSSIPCWFSAAPQAEQTGKYLTVTVGLVDANQALEVLLRQQEQEIEAQDRPDLGTITLGSAVITLTKPVDTFASTPQVEFTAGGVHYVTGPLVPYSIKDVEGETTASGWTALRNWYASTVSTLPATGSLFPISAPTATAENRIVDGVKTTIYTVTVQAGVII